MDQTTAVVALSALAHGHRLAVFRMLVVRGPSGALAGEIAREVGMGATAASFHLKELDRAGLVIATRQGRNIRYSLHVEGVRRLLTFLTEDCCRGRPEICGSIFVNIVDGFEAGDGSPSPCCAPSCSEVLKPNPTSIAVKKSGRNSSDRRQRSSKLKS